MRIIHPFLPIMDEKTEVLILGSFPSVVSRQNNFYYGNPQNRFWKVLSAIYDVQFVLLNNEEKKNVLLRHHVGLYDVVESCTITGSSDASISDVIYSDIPRLIKNTNISRIYLNGTKAYDLFIKAFPDFEEIAIKMPSTSPANAKKKLDNLIEEWSIIKNTED